MSKRPSRGFGLTETLLTLGALSALSLGIYMVLAPASASATAKKEQDNLRDLSGAVDRSFGLLGSYDGVSTSRVEADGLAPPRMLQGGRLRTSWGTGVDVVPHRVREPGDAFLVAYPLAPAAVCARLASAVARNVYDVRVDGVSVFDDGRLNPSAAAAACGQRDAASMEFVYYSGLVAGTAVAAPPLVMPPSSVAPHTPTPPGTATPVGPVDPVAPAAGVSPVAAPPPAPTAPAPAAPLPQSAPAPAGPVSPVVAPTPAGPPGTRPACAVPPPSVENRAPACAAGSVGAINERRTAAWSCPEAWEAPRMGAWSAWAQTSNTCSPCPAPETRPVSCPAGQLGSITEQRTFNCAGTGSWGGWTQIANSCAPACVLPTSSTQTNAETRTGSQTLACPSGQSGAITQTRTEQRTQTRAASCPAPTGSFTWGAWSAWTAWAGTSVWTTTSNTCATNCVLPTPSTQTNSEQRTGTQTLGCPAGQTGAITQTRQEQRTQTRSASCPAPTGSFTWGAWSAWTAWTGTSAWSTTSNTCATPAPACASAPGAPALVPVGTLVCIGRTGMSNLQSAVEAVYPGNTYPTGMVYHSAQGFNCVSWSTVGSHSQSIPTVDHAPWSGQVPFFARRTFTFDGQTYAVRINSVVDLSSNYMNSAGMGVSRTAAGYRNIHYGNGSNWGNGTLPIGTGFALLTARVTSSGSGYVAVGPLTEACD